MSNSYIVFNGAEPTTASRVKVITIAATARTMLQIATPAGVEIIPIAWGVSLDASAAGVPGMCELIETDVAATGGTSLTPTRYGNPTGPASICVGGAALTMFTPAGATTEGTIGAVRTADAQLIAPTSQYNYQWPLGREFRVGVSKFLRVRLNFAVAVGALCWVAYEE